MMIESSPRRLLGTMIAYGFADLDLDSELRLAKRIGASVVEIFPEWRLEPDPRVLRDCVAGAGLSIHSAHGCWGGQTIRAPRVDLGHPDPQTQEASLDDLKRCIDWLHAAGGTCLVVHPGGLSEPWQSGERREALTRGLVSLAEHAQGTGVTVCVENMPPGVYPGSRMKDLASVLAQLARPGLALALDTGHAHISADVPSETLSARGWLRTTHVHDNDGRQDTHHPPGLGSIAWDAWLRALDDIQYGGPIMLECIRYLRKHPEVLDGNLNQILALLTASSVF